MVAEVGSISKAAAALNLPQPSLTVQLRRIEKAVGGDLFIRSSSGVTPTPLGRRLIPMLVELARHADAVLAEASAPRDTVLRLGNAEWTPATLPGAIQASLPDLDVRTETVDAAAAVDALARGALAAALMPSVETLAPQDVPDTLDKAVVVREPVWLALPQDHPFAARDTVTTAQLATLSWVRHGADHWFHTVEDYLFGQLGNLRPEVLHQVGSHAEAMSWVRDAGAAALITPTGATREVRLVPLHETPRTEMLLVWRRDALREDVRHELVQAVRRYYCTYARTLPRYWAWMVEHAEEFTELDELLPRTGCGLHGVGC